MERSCEAIQRSLAGAGERSRCRSLVLVLSLADLELSLERCLEPWADPELDELEELPDDELSDELRALRDFFFLRRCFFFLDLDRDLELVSSMEDEEEARRRLDFESFLSLDLDRDLDLDPDLSRHVTERSGGLWSDCDTALAETAVAAPDGGNGGLRKDSMRPA